MKKVLITGGAGFIGHHLAKKLINKSIKVNILDNLSTGKLKNIQKNTKFIKGDVKKYNDVVKASKECDAIFHLAASTQLQKSIVDPSETIQNNVIGTVNIIKICLKKKINLIFASSCSIYDLNAKVKLKENENVNPENPYALSKFIGEKLIKFYGKNQNLKFNILRFFNVFGPNQNENGTYAAVIPTFIKAALKKQKLYLHNKGEQSRDFIHVFDVITALINSANSINNDIYNIGSGKSLKIKNLAKIITKELKCGKLVDGKKLYSDANYSCANISKAIKDLKFKPKNSIKKYLKNVNQQK